MRCPFCYFEFDEDEAQSACASCYKSSGGSDGCGMAQCPRCHYEIPLEPKWIKNLRQFFNRRKKNGPIGKSPGSPGKILDRK